MKKYSHIPYIVNYKQVLKNKTWLQNKVTHITNSQFCAHCSEFMKYNLHEVGTCWQAGATSEACFWGWVYNCKYRSYKFHNAMSKIAQVFKPSALQILYTNYSRWQAGATSEACFWGTVQTVSATWINRTNMQIIQIFKPCALEILAVWTQTAVADRREPQVRPVLGHHANCVC